MLAKVKQEEIKIKILKKFKKRLFCVFFLGANHHLNAKTSFGVEDIMMIVNLLRFDYYGRFSGKIEEM